MDEKLEAQCIQMIQRDHERMRKAGGRLAAAAMHVVTEGDGLHRLSLAIAEWANAIANEGDRPHSAVDSEAQ